MDEATGARLAGTRIALVLASSTGGIGRHVRSLAAGLAERGAEVSVIGPAATDRIFGFGAGFAALPGGPAGLVRLRRLLADADVVHAHGLRAGLRAAAGGGRVGPLVVTWHNPPPQGAPARRLARALLRRTDVTLAASEDLAARARALGGRDVRAAPVGAPMLAAPVRSPAEVRAALGVDGRPLVLAIGRLHPQKGYDTLIAAARQWTGRRPVPLVVIAGDGPLRADLERAVDRIGAPVRLLGRRADVADLLAAADLVVLPSRWEARSLTAQEAVRAGVPLVATAVGGLPELLGDGAVFVPPADAAALAGAVARLLDDPAEAALVAERGRARAVDWPTELDTVGQVAALYRELLGAPC